MLIFLTSVESTYCMAKTSVSDIKVSPSDELVIKAKRKTLDSRKQPII